MAVPTAALLGWAHLPVLFIPLPPGDALAQTYRLPTSKSGEVLDLALMHVASTYLCFNMTTRLCDSALLVISKVPDPNLTIHLSLSFSHTRKFNTLYHQGRTQHGLQPRQRNNKLLHYFEQQLWISRSQCTVPLCPGLQLHVRPMQQ